MEGSARIPALGERGLMIRTFLSVGLLLCVVSSAVAQQGEELKGLTNLGLLIEEPDQETQQCGITRSLIRDAIAYTISSTKLNFSEDNGSGPKIYVTAEALVQRQPVQCFSVVSLDVVLFRPVQLDYTGGPPRVVTVQLWHDEWLQVSTPERHSQQAESAIENATKKLIAAWYLANEP